MIFSKPFRACVLPADEGLIYFKDRERALPSTSSLPSTVARGGQARPWAWNSAWVLPKGRPNTWGVTCYFQSWMSEGSWNQRQSWELNLDTTVLDADIPNSQLKLHQRPSHKTLVLNVASEALQDLLQVLSQPFFFFVTDSSSPLP